MVHNTDTAIIKACEKFNCSITNYTIAPIFINKESGAHQWFIEFTKRPVNLNNFIKEVDHQIKQLNSDYKAKRQNNLILTSPKLVVIENNEFYTWLKANNRLGGQYKIPKLCNNRKLAEDLLSIKEKFSTKITTNNK